MTTGRIVLAGASAAVQGLRWEATDILRIGRLVNNDIVLPDIYIGKQQAEVRLARDGWFVRDLAAGGVVPSCLNGEQLHGREVKLGLHDVLQFGRVRLKVAAIEFAQAPPLRAPADKPSSVPDFSHDIRTSRGFLRVQAATHQTWDEALQTIVADPAYLQRQSEHFLMLLRTGQHLRHLASLDDLLDSVLKDAIRALGAQRGAIALADERGELRLRALQAPLLPERSDGMGFSRTLAQRSFAQGESLLCQDVRAEAALMSAASVRRGEMTSIICALLRSPRHRLGVLHLDRGPFQEPFTPYDFYLADAIAASVAVGIESAILVEQQQREFYEAVTSLARTVEFRDQYTGDHTRRVTEYSVLLARELLLPSDEVERIKIGTPLHDIGKIGVDDAILRKPGRLSRAEFEAMKAHTLTGVNILQSMRSFEPMIPIVRHHHERWDGTGYPDQLARDRIPIIARVVAVADAFDAMTSDRPYRPALSTEAAFTELQKNAGSHFDPACVSAFLRLRPVIEARVREE